MSTILAIAVLGRSARLMWPDPFPARQVDDNLAVVGTSHRPDPFPARQVDDDLAVVGTSHRH
jgi:hypothetical protein